jgi:RNA polymerase sigma factor FliA
MFAARAVSHTTLGVGTTMSTLAERNELIQTHGHLVFRTFKRHSAQFPRRLREDLLQCGWVGLVRAANQWDPTRGVRFSTYAIALIRGAMREWVRTTYPLPRSIQERRARGETRPEWETPLPVEQVPGHLLIDPTAGPEVRALRSLEAEQLRSAMRGLPAREAQVIRLYYWERWPQREIAELVGVCESRVHQLRRQGEARLRTRLS